jgi:hypothetical protein
MLTHAAAGSEVSPMAPFGTAEYRHQHRAQARAAAKALAEAGATGDAGKFFQALGSLKEALS